MAAPTRLSRREAREQTRERVLGAAREIFVRDGFHRASTDRIATAAGYSRGALYASWRTKEALFFDVLDTEVDKRFARLQPSGRGSFEQQLRSLARRYRRMLEQDPGWSLLMVEFTAHAARHPDIASQLRDRNTALVGRLAGELQGSFGHTATQARRSAHAMLLLQSGFVVEWMASGASLTDDVPEDLIAALSGPPWLDR